jgi:hypothetical protein
MKKEARYLFIFLLLVPATSALSLDIAETTYTQGESVYFTLCGDKSPARVSCVDQADVHTGPWRDACTVHAFDTRDLYCYDPVITASHQGETVRQPLTIARYRQTLQAKMEAVNDTSDPVTAAKLIYAHNLLGNEDEIEPLLEYLKQSRDNEKKCWPAGECELATTIDILWYLSYGGIDTTRRVYKDAILWLEIQQNNVNNDDWTFTVTASEDDSCTVKEDDDTIASFTLDDDEKNTFSRDLSSGSRYNFTCDGGFCASITDDDDFTLVDKCESSGDTISYVITEGCWPTTSQPTTRRSSSSTVTSKSCSPILTAKALSVKGLADEVRDEGEAWVKDNIVDARIRAKKLKESQDILKNVFAYSVTKDEAHKRWLLYSQNNEGSFGQQDNVYTTLQAINFLGDQDNEWINDAEDWLFAQRPDDGWDSLEADAIMLDIYGTQQPVLSSDPTLPLGNESLSFDLTTLESESLNLSLADADNVAIDASSGGTTHPVRITPNGKEDGILRGYVRAVQDEFRRDVPFVLFKNSEVTPRFRSTYYVFNSTGSIDVPVVKTESTLECSFSFSGVFTNTTVTLTDQDSVTFRYEVPDMTKDLGVAATYRCTGGLRPVQGSTTFDVRVFSSPPFSVEWDDAMMDDTPATLLVTNELDEAIDVDAQLVNASPFYTLTESTTLEAGEYARMTLCQSTPAPSMPNETNAVRLSSFTYTMTTPSFEARLMNATHDVEGCGVTTDSSLPWGSIFMYSTLTVFVAATGYGGYRAFSGAEKEEAAAAVADEEGEDGDERVDHNRELAEVLTAVDRFLGESDDEITHELEDEGYREDEIEAVMGELESFTFEKVTTSDDDDSQPAEDESGDATAEEAGEDGGDGEKSGNASSSATGEDEEKTT